MHGSKKIVSIVDDDTSVRGALWRLMTAYGYEARTFASGEEFLSAGCPPVGSCILVDYAMHGMNGFELKAALDRAGCRSPVILITAFGDTDLKERAKAAGIPAVFLKPVDGNALAVVIKQLMTQTADQAGVAC